MVKHARDAAAVPGQSKAKKGKSALKQQDIGTAFKFKSYVNLFGGISSEHRELLIQDCKSCFSCREVEDGDNYSLGSTFFIKANEASVCGMEVLAKKIFDLHTQGMTYDPATSGAEWWTQHIDHRDNIGFHWDRDYGKEEDDQVHVHPFLGSVTYLCVNAGPTVILDKRGTFEYGADISGPLRQCIVSRPTPGKHITFDGELLHGAPSDLAFPHVNEDDDTSVRVTFLVNIWLNHVPIQSQRLEPTVASTLKLEAKHVESLALITTDAEPTPDVEVYDAKSVKHVTHRFAINSGGDDYIIQLILPEQLKGCATETTVDCVHLHKDSAIVAGELTESSDDEEDDEDDEEDE
ncbi:hypothetical protein DYB36_005857 [Aphanomyces astaci]|uniref:Uncharacterized protein n=2 Tax=Aphanomyces astaci TaxID=112090 RepID=A0A397ABF8_APHAT|nr:hypothetical protein DYB36_005857 [Aphanomyces astaci]